MCKSNANPFWWFLAGACVGVAVGIILAPAPGSATRESLFAAADQAGEYLVQSGRDMYESARHAADDTSAMFQDGKRLMYGAEYV